ncbi:SOS response-associated peptidase family protein [Stutzerimonas stutzeri]
MCGRLAQRRAAEKYLASLGSQHPVRECAHSGHRPIQCRAALARGPAQAGRRRSGMEPGTLGLDAQLGQGTHAPRHHHATREKVANSAYFRQIWPNRALFCTDGWYEWCPIDGQKTKQAYYIHRRDTEPLFIAANGQFPAAGSESRADDGFRIITADSQGGMLDVHDRRPVVLDALRARLWLSDSALAWPTSSFRLARLPSMPSSGIRWGETWTTRETRVPI